MSSVSILAQIAEKLVIYRPILQLFAAVLVFLIFWGLKKKFTSLLTELLYRLLNHKKQWISKESVSSYRVQHFISQRKLFRSHDPFPLHFRFAGRLYRPVDCGLDS